ncbi:hypothetical protein SGLAD_v1c07170 [Spiroplasma gladiatoris]|uniref:Uncharacterized protein n=1 Tax=Spiroplasma gladiatoris TaxID=2143 RepID=A0A4P7AJR9_9MOLU|nr:hypothetical protein [Spiroplasma gladiatoris]QBQ07916.1 hypothetical protein SGLAD_v1c07170 [Spiroplasma gladiatoris]
MIEKVKIISNEKFPSNISNFIFACIILLYYGLISTILYYVLKSIKILICGIYILKHKNLKNDLSNIDFKNFYIEEAKKFNIELDSWEELISKN